MEVRFISNSARPLTRPGRCTRRISPCTKVPGGITMRLFMVMGNEVCAFFTTPDDLATKIVTGLANFFEGRWNPDPYVLVVGSASGEYILRLDSPLRIDQKQSVD